MGRYVSNAIITKMTIYRGKYSQSFKDDTEFIAAKDEILGEIGKNLNLELFNLKYYDDAIQLCLKEEVVKKHLFDLIREFSNYGYPVCLTILHRFGISEEEFLNSKQFDESKYRLSLNHDRDWDGEIDLRKNITIYCNEKTAGKMSPFLNTYQYSMFEPSFKYLNGRKSDIDIYCEGTPFWIDPDKYYGEDANEMLRLLNLLSRKTIKNPLGNALLYYIDG